MSNYLTSINTMALFLPYSKEQSSIYIPTTEELQEIMEFNFKKCHHDTPIIENNEPFLITIVTITGKKININVHPLDTIYHIKQEIYKKDNDILIDQQRLIYNGKQLDDETTVKNTAITVMCSLHLILRLRGGMFHYTSSRNDYVSLNFNTKRDKAFSMIQHMRDKYNIIEIIDNIHASIIQCSTDEEMDQVFSLIEKYYIA